MGYSSNAGDSSGNSNSGQGPNLFEIKKRSIDFFQQQVCILVTKYICNDEWFNDDCYRKIRTVEEGSTQDKRILLWVMLILIH